MVERAAIGRWNGWWGAIISHWVQWNLSGGLSRCDWRSPGLAPWWIQPWLVGVGAMEFECTMPHLSPEPTICNEVGSANNSRIEVVFQDWQHIGWGKFVFVFEPWNTLIHSWYEKISGLVVATCCEPLPQAVRNGQMQTGDLFLEHGFIKFPCNSWFWKVTRCSRCYGGYPWYVFLLTKYYRVTSESRESEYTDRKEGCFERSQAPILPSICRFPNGCREHHPDQRCIC